MFLWRYFTFRTLSLEKTAVAKTYKVLKNGKSIESAVPGRFAGNKPRKIFGRLDCASGARMMKKGNRVFFLTWEDALASGYHPCKKCKPAPQDIYDKT